jgi:hypothetical protein
MGQTRWSRGGAHRIEDTSRNAPVQLLGRSDGQPVDGIRSHLCQCAHLVCHRRTSEPW